MDIENLSRISLLGEVSTFLAEHWRYPVVSIKSKGLLNYFEVFAPPWSFFSCTTEMKFLLHPGRLLHFVPLIDTTEHRFEIVCNSSILYVNFQQVFKDSRYSVDPYVKGKAQIFYSNIKLKCLIAFYLAHQFRN